MTGRDLGSHLPAALVTGEVSPYRREPFRLLAAAEGVEVLTWAQRGETVPAALAVRRTTERGVVRLIAAGGYRAVICGLGGRLAVPGSYLAARRAGVPYVLWASLWSHPRTLAHRLSWPAMRHIYRHANAVVTYGPHVSSYVARHRGGRAGVFEAPQAVSATEFGTPVGAVERASARARVGAGDSDFLALFVGRLEPEKGVDVLVRAWRQARVGSGSVLAVAGSGSLGAKAEEDDIRLLGSVERASLPALYAAADVLILPSIRTATFTEPWGLVVNEAMHQGTPTIASDAVGAVAGGLIVDGRNGLVVPAADVDALAACIRAMASDRELRARLGVAARTDVEAFSEAAWVDGMRRALRYVGSGQEHVR